MQEPRPVKSGKLVENPKRLDVPEVATRFIRLQSLDSCPHRLGDGWEMPLGELREALRVARDWERRDKGVPFVHDPARANVPKSYSEEVKSATGILEKVAEYEREWLVLDGSDDLCVGDVSRWCSIWLDAEGVAISFFPPSELGFQLLEVLRCPPKLSLFWLQPLSVVISPPWTH